MFRILWNRGLPALQEEGNPNRAKYSSASRVYNTQCAFLRLVEVRMGGSGRLIWKLPSWSELRAVRVRHSASKATWKEVIVRLRRRRSEFVRDSVIRVSHASASVHVV